MNLNTKAMLSVSKSMLGVTSDYAIAKALGVSRATVSNYQAGKSCPDGTVCRKLSEILKVPYGWILVMVQIDRTSGDERLAWEQIMDDLSSRAVKQ